MLQDIESTERLLDPRGTHSMDESPKTPQVANTEPVIKYKRGRPRKTDPPRPPKPETLHPERRAKNTPIAKLADLKAKNPGLSSRQLGKIVGISHTAVNTLFKRHNVDVEQLEQFREHRADLLTLHQERVLASISEEDLKKASARDKAIVFGTLYDKERLERGQSTSNQSVFFAIVAESCSGRSERDRGGDDE